MSTATITESVTFTITHARKLASKVATDLKRMQRFYLAPDDERIDRLESEIVVLLKSGALGTLTYGFQRDGDWIKPTLRYTARELAEDGLDDDPGRVEPRCNIVGASFYSYLTYSTAWDRLTQAEKDAITRQLPFKRTGAPEPGVDGYFFDDRSYSSGGRGLSRATVRSY
jgi:hypothetical protein